MNKKIKIGLFVLIILGTITLSLTYKSNDKVIKTKKRKQNNLAIMIKEDGATDYTKSNSKDIPKGDYVLNRDKSYCKNNGKIGDYDSVLGKVSFSFIGTDSCYLYFDYKEDKSLYRTIKKRAKTDTTYLALYRGEGADTYANPVYYYKGNVQNNNVFFAGFCWKIVRTTETGGVKIVYNGVQKNGSCNNTGTDSQIGTIAFNNSTGSPADVGYMYNAVYSFTEKNMQSLSNIIFGNSFTYSNGTYILKDTKTVATWSSGYNTINNNHYTCMTTGTTCSSIYYVYNTSSSYAYYITLTNGKSVNDALIEMLYANNVNKNDSKIKNYIDKWYITNLRIYQDKLEDTVFCNDRRILNLNGWNPNGGDTTVALQFKNNDTSNQSLVCTNDTDSFSMSNTKAKLSYPIGLLSVPELSLAGYGSSHYFNNGQSVWLDSPIYFNSFFARVGGTSSGGFTDDYVFSSRGVRPSVSLKPNTEFTEGDGSFTNPFVIGDAVEEPSGKSFETVFAANNTDIFNENGLRYEGADPKNYICLDNKTEGACSNSSLLFRIIGLFDEDTSTDGTSSSGTKKLLKLIDTNNYGGTSGKKWNDNDIDYSNVSNDSNDIVQVQLLKNRYKIKTLAPTPSVKSNNIWSTATLKTELNGTYLSTLLATSGVNSKLNSAIVTSKWHLGGANDTSSSNYYYKRIITENWYKAERSPYATSGTLQNLYSGNPEYVFAKVGLMYPSDYGYASVGGSTTSKANCRTMQLYNWDSSSYSDCKNNDWVFKSATFIGAGEWFISPNSSYSYSASAMSSTGILVNNNLVYERQFAVRPTFYLDSSVLKIVGGTGTSDNAYRIG